MNCLNLKLGKLTPDLGEPRSERGVTLWRRYGALGEKLLAPLAQSREARVPLSRVDDLLSPIMVAPQIEQPEPILSAEISKPVALELVESDLQIVLHATGWTVVMVEPSSFVSAFSPVPEFSTSTAAALHMEDTAPQNITSGSPSKSMFQIDSVTMPTWLPRLMSSARRPSTGSARSSARTRSCAARWMRCSSFWARNPLRPLM
jgi:hypothetical protein